MDFSKKRKSSDENDVAFLSNLSPSDIHKILQPFTKEQLIDILQNAVVRDSSLLNAVRSVADSDVKQRKLFIRGLGWETTTEKLRSVFSEFGELEEGVVITEKGTSKSKGYGFVTYKHIDGAFLALKEPNKKIDGRMCVAQLAILKDATAGIDVSMRKIYVGNVPFEIESERLLNYFASYGDIEEGPLGFDKQSGKSKGFAFFVYKTEEGARASLAEPVKNIDGYQVICKFATDGKKGKIGVGGAQTGLTGAIGGGAVLPQPGGMNSNYVAGGMPSYTGYSGGPPPPYQNPAPLPLSIGSAQGVGSRAQPHFAVGAGGGFSGGAGAGAGAGMNNPGSMFRMPPTSGGYPDGGNFALASSGYPTQLHQPPSGPRGPSPRLYPGMPPYY